MRIRLNLTATDDFGGICARDVDLHIDQEVLSFPTAGNAMDLVLVKLSEAVGFTLEDAADDVA